MISFFLSFLFVYLTIYVCLCVSVSLCLSVSLTQEHLYNSKCFFIAVGLAVHRSQLCRPRGSGRRQAWRQSWPLVRILRMGLSCI